MSNKDNEKYNWWQAAHDHGYGWAHGFQSRGIAPSFLGSDSLPQGIADLHWALHGLQGNMDQLDAKMGTFQDNISKIANDMKDDVIKYLADKLAGSKTPLTTDTGYISKMLTTRTRIFSDSYGPETAMNPRDRIRGLTENYNWIQYTQKNPTCEGEYDKVIDFDFVADHQESDGVDSMYVTKGKIILDKVGLIKRVFVTQKETNIVLWYLLTQTIPSDLGVSYTGAIKRVEYDKDSNLVSEKWLSVNHTPLVMLGAFSGDANNETEYVQYISTDYKVYQNIDGVDKEIGQLPNDVIMLIDPVNDIVSDSKQAYIMKYTNDGKLRMPLEGFTLIDTMDTGKVVEKFKIIKFENNNRLFTSFVSISPRTETTLSREFDPNKIMTNEGGYYVELYDDNNVYPNVTHSHIFLLSSTEEVYDLDRFASNIMNYHSDEPSPFSRKRERDYTEFGQITFKSKINRMFPEIAQDFGIRDDVPFTLETDKSKQLERVTVWLKEPFILERDISERAVNTRQGYTVVHNSDFVKDVADTDILSVYKQLDFVNKVPTTRNYLSTLPKYDETYQLPKYLRYKVVDHSDVERGAGKIEVTYFDEINSVSATIDAPRKEIIGNIKYNENLTEVYNKRTNKFSPSVKSQYLSDLIHSDVIYLEGKDFLDKPYGSKQYVLKNETTGSRVTQRLYTSTTGNADTNNDAGTVFKNRIKKVEPKITRREITVYDTSTVSDSLTFNVTDNISISTSEEHVPMDLIQIIDMSGSLSDSEYKQRNGVYGARKRQLSDMKYVIETQLNDQDHVMIAVYGTNTTDSYTTNGPDGSLVTRLITKQQAIGIINSLINTPEVSSDSQSWVLIPNVIKGLMSGYLIDTTEKKGFEDVYEEQPNKNRVVSVLQFTDDWTANETIDASFADWAKRRAKTFMSVIDGVSGKSSTSYIEMTKAGHPNIQVFTRLDEPNRQLTIAEKFKSTAVETQIKKTKKQISISLSELNSITIDSISLSGPQNVSLNKSGNVYSGTLNEGSYTLSVSASSKTETPRSFTISVSADNKVISTKAVNIPVKSHVVIVNENDNNNSPGSTSVKDTLAKHYSNVPVEESVFTRTIVNGKVGEWFGSGYITELKYLNIPGSYNTGTLEDGNYFQSANPAHEVFNNIVTRGIFVEGVTNNMTHVVYRVTNDLGLSMSYHNIALREDRTDNIGYTSKPYRLLYSKWIPGEYVGNDDYPYPPDASAFDKEVLRRISHLEARNLEVEDTNSIDLTKTGDWKKIVEGSWDPTTNNWTVPDNIITIKADAKIGSGTQKVTLNGKEYDLPNALKVTDNGLFVPDYGKIIGDLSKQVNDSNRALKEIIKSLIDNGAWDPNKSSSNSDNTSLSGGLKSGINIAYGNINLFGGTPDGDHYIRTNSGQTEDDLAGGI